MFNYTRSVMNLGISSRPLFVLSGVAPLHMEWNYVVALSRLAEVK